MTWRTAAVSISITVTSIFLAGWFVFNSPAGLQLKAASPHRDTAAFGSILYQATVTAAPLTPSAAPPTPTPVPPTPTPTPAASASGSKNSLPVVPIFLGIMFVGLVLAVALPIIRSRFGRR